MKQKIVIAKSVNQRDALAILTNKMKLREPSTHGKRILKTNKVYVNALLCPSCKCIMEKGKSLLKKKYIASFYIINVKIKTMYESNNVNVTNVVNHEANLVNR